jgi:hypothetical protein
LKTTIITATGYSEFNMPAIFDTMPTPQRNSSNTSDSSLSSTSPPSWIGFVVFGLFIVFTALFFYALLVYVLICDSPRRSAECSHTPSKVAKSGVRDGWTVPAWPTAISAGQQDISKAASEHTIPRLPDKALISSNWASRTSSYEAMVSSRSCPTKADSLLNGKTPYLFPSSTHGLTRN